MLDEGILAAQRAHGLLSQPVRHARPAENVTAGSDGRIFHRLEAEGTFPLLFAVDPLHDLWVVQVVAMCLRQRRVRHF